ncbi:MFS transporter [Ornithinimicrobium cavernae]|uniref:MFS transporter n=1 Tax=Ornithinimicrobium cavernae TaxID=2666047 RepID=UPI00137A3FDC|nr:MFS transporter [Ornithinimicrobium cavernae]
MVAARHGRIITLVTLVTVGSVLPVFLLGVNGPAIMDELGLDATGIGIAAGSYTAGLAVASLALGRWLDSGPLVRAAAFSLVPVATGGVITALAAGLPVLALGLCVSGVGSSAIQMSIGRILGQLLTTGHGAAFGWFQSAKPVAVALAGGFGLLAVVGLPWRWSFLLVVAVTSSLGVVLTFWCNRLVPTHPAATPRVPLRGDVLLLAVLMGVGFALTNISTTFIPDTVLAAGGHEGWAGTLLLIGGSLAAVGRVLAGRLTDRTGRDEVSLVGPAFVTAGLGSVLISTLNLGGLLVGCVLVFALGWAFGGLLIAKGARLHPGTSGAVVGQLLLGGAVGGSAAPPLFGTAATAWGYDTAWLVWGAVILALGCLCVWLGRPARPR